MVNGLAILPVYINKVQDIRDRKSYAMKIQEDAQNLAKKTVVKDIQKSKSEQNYRKDCIKASWKLQSFF